MTVTPLTMRVCVPVGSAWGKSGFGRRQRSPVMTASSLLGPPLCCQDLLSYLFQVARGQFVEGGRQDFAAGEAPPQSLISARASSYPVTCKRSASPWARTLAAIGISLPSASATMQPPNSEAT